jgi:predicted nucleic-acid-binding protein
VTGIDTNVLVRFLTADDPRQFALARELVERNPVFIPKTVLVETEWVLRTGYGFAPSAISAALRGVLGLSNVSAEDEASVNRALDWHDQGFDFADALHLASCNQADGFATFDRTLERRARSAQNVPRIALLT